MTGGWAPVGKVATLGPAVEAPPLPLPAMAPRCRTRGGGIELVSLNKGRESIMVAGYTGRNWLVGASYSIFFLEQQ